jgi:glycosyltransferase involved in cell wall biosynthesis
LKRINLAVICPIPNDTLSFWRGIGPLAELRRIHPELTLCFLNEVYWHTAACVDVAFLQRPFTPSHLVMAQVFKASKVPLWVDFDDDLFSIPPWNPCHRQYMREDVQKTIAEVMALADVVTVSTPQLAAKFAPLNPNIIVIPNALNMHLIGPARAPIPENRNLILWRGSKTHVKDLNVMAEAAIHLSKTYQDVTWMFMGEVPWFVDFMPRDRVISAESIDPVEYFQFLAKVRPAILCTPLVDCEFNRGKSNIAWLEGSWCGAAVLAPRWPEWAQPGVTSYVTSADFCQQLERMIVKRMSDGIASACDSWEHIYRHLTLDTVNSQRMDVLEGLLDGRYRHVIQSSRSHAGCELSGDDVSVGS